MEGCNLVSYTPVMFWQTLPLHRDLKSLCMYVCLISRSGRLNDGYKLYMQLCTATKGKHCSIKRRKLHYCDIVHCIHFLPNVSHHPLNKWAISLCPQQTLQGPLKV